MPEDDKTEETPKRRRRSEPEAGTSAVAKFKDADGAVVAEAQGTFRVATPSEIFKASFDRYKARLEESPEWQAIKNVAAHFGLKLEVNKPRGTECSVTFSGPSEKLGEAHVALQKKGYQFKSDIAAKSLTVSLKTKLPFPC